MKKTTLLLMAVPLISVLSVFAYDSSSRLTALEKFNVKKNAYRLIKTNSCPGCYLVNAKLSHMDLTEANLAGANLIGATFIKATLLGANINGAKIAGADFSGAQWIDGSICQPRSVGQCLKRQVEE